MQMVWLKDPGPTVKRGYPRIFFAFLEKVLQNISIFVDESGDFGKYRELSHYYIVTMVIHNQNKDISEHIAKLNHDLSFWNLEKNAVHTAPLIRREEVYMYMQPLERRKIFQKLYSFALNCEIQYKTFIYDKKSMKDVFMLEEKIFRDITSFFYDNLEYFQEFDKVIMYYDNGQRQLHRILNLALAASFTKYEIRLVFPSEYKLFQVADLICTMELLNKKFENSEMTRSEKLIFHSKRAFKKDFFKGLRKKSF